ncbi:hypothetical protein CLU79DRAFT_744664 [Phycomyces nitens]|nr:hypothetical protein CLU79DRAFT_744664 [Phycomyces nitens]
MIEAIDYPIDIGILASYFVLIGLLVWRIWPLVHNSLCQATPTPFIFLALAALSFLSTWTYMFAFFNYSYQAWKASSPNNIETTLNSMSHWLHDVSLFDDAWRTVNVGTWQWLWSHQLCSFTVAVWTPLLAIEGTRRKIPYAWAFMLLGQVVAISVATALFFAVLYVNPVATPGQPSGKLSVVLLASVLGGIITVVLSPFVAETSQFMPTLLVMHALLIIPLVYKPSSDVKREGGDLLSSVLTMATYLISTGANLILYCQQWFEAIVSLPPKSTLLDILRQLSATFFSHPAQSSISSDILCVNLICMFWMAADSFKAKKAIPCQVLALIALTPILSSSVTLPVFLACREYRDYVFHHNKAE